MDPSLRHASFRMTPVFQKKLPAPVILSFLVMVPFPVILSFFLSF
jgi:hypothetical protein